MILSAETVCDLLIEVHSLNNVSKDYDKVISGTISENKNDISGKHSFHIRGKIVVKRRIIKQVSTTLTVKFCVVLKTKLISSIGILNGKEKRHKKWVPQNNCSDDICLWK